jgi:hypothetical protein
VTSDPQLAELPEYQVAVYVGLPPDHVVLSVIDCPLSIVGDAGVGVDGVLTVALTTMVLDDEVKTYGVFVPVSVAVTLNVCVPCAGTLVANVRVPALWPVSVLTTVPPLIRLSVNGPVPPAITTL